MFKAIVFLLLVGVIGYVVGVGFAGGPAHSDAGPPPGAAASDAQQARPTAPPVAPQAEAAATAVSEGQPFSMTIGEDEVNAHVGDVPTQTVETPMGEAELLDPHVRFVPGEALVEGKVDAGPLSAPFTAHIRPRIDANGQVALDVTAIDLGGVPLPGPVRERVRDAAQARLRDALGQLPVQLDTIQVRQGQIVVSGD